MSPRTAPLPDTEHDWEEAGRAWGHAAADWACLYEGYAIDAFTSIHRQTQAGPATELLDLACGSGLALRHAAALGASTAGIDAAAALVAIARDRDPAADVRLGSMFDLPWDDATFDVVTSVNGIWGSCQGALEEAFRVLRPGGCIGISFWGRGEPLDLRSFFRVVARHTPDPIVGGMRRTNAISHPGVAEEMLAGAGFVAAVRTSVVSVVEWPDADIAYRALTSTGPSLPALESADPEQLRAEVMAAVEPCRDRSGIYRFRNDHQIVVARKP